MLVRIITGLIGIPLMLMVLYYGKLALLVTVLLLIILGLKEYHNIITKINLKYVAVLSYIFAIMFPLTTYFNFPIETVFLVSFILFTTITLLYYKLEIKDSATQWFGIVYIGVLPTYILKIRMLPDGFKYIMLTFLFIWMSDSAAYFVGRLLGKHKLAPTISPKKTIEGSIGGLVFTLGLAYFMGKFLIISTYITLGTAILVNVFAQLGDLVESIIKRQANIKDSGNLLPGHGGILDRFDSAFLTAPLVYYFLLFF